ncbi:MAG TPA: hypothetical protein VFP21_06325 [Solirubrobacterales bacterium]|nr:hypothetical protein [Solirubrobacterales bacterium]
MAESRGLVGGGRGAWWSLVALAGAVALLLGAARADAAPTYVASFGTSGTEAGQFAHPAGIAIANGSLWIVDQNHYRVQRVSESGVYQSSLGSQGSGNGQFARPTDVAVAGGYIWVTDASNNRIEQFTEKSSTFVKAIGTFGTGPGQFKGPEALAIDAAGNIWVGDTYNHRVQEFNAAGEFIRAFGSYGSGPGQIIESTGIAIDAEGNVWVVDWGNNRVEEFTETGTFIRQFGSEGIGNGQFMRPDVIDIDPQGHIWVGDQNNDRVQEFTPTGEYLSQFGAAGSGPGQFNFGWPMGIAADSKGAMWVSDTGNNRVQKWQLEPDVYPPDTSVSGPKGRIETATASFSLGSTEIASTFQCSFDGSAFASCTSPKTYSGLVDGPHTFLARAIDSAGNQDPTPVERTFTVAVPPDTTITEGPTGTSGSSSTSFSFSSTDFGSTFQCSLDGAAYAACSSPQAYGGLGNGAHTFKVRAIDPAGNVDPSPAERKFEVNTLANSATMSSPTYRSSTSDVAGGGAYNYAPTVMLDGSYKVWWCGGIAGDHILYGESSSLNGPFHAPGSGNQYLDVLQPTAGSELDATHTCDPSVIRVRGTYYMYYGGLSEGTGKPTQIGVASSNDGINWTKLNNDRPIVTPRNPGCGCYGAGQPSAAYVDGYFYLMYTDASGLNGGTQYAIRSIDPTFQSGVETATASGWALRTSSNYDTYVVSNSFSPDWQYSDALNAWIVLSNQDGGKTFVRFLSRDLSHVLRPDLEIPSSWSEGPGLVSTPEKHAVAPPNGECQRIKLDFIQSTPPASPPNDLKHFGEDLLTGRGCSQLTGEQVSGMFNGYGIEVWGLPLTVVVEKKRLQFQLSAPAQDITHNFIGTTSEVFYAIPYGASLFSGSTVLGASGRPAAFQLDGGVLWPVSSIKVITDDNSSITYVSQAEFDSYPVGPSLYEVR